MPKRSSKTPRPARKTTRTSEHPGAKPSPHANPESSGASNASSFPVVGIGASAGGLEALSQLLTHLPVDTGMAFVIVQHLDPHRESMLAEILSRSTAMSVTDVDRPTPVEPNHVYLATRGTDIRIQSRALQSIPYVATGRPHLAVDYFFRSLAEDLKNRAIGVILSGTGSDGSLGLKAVKAEGGITFAQDEKSARYDGMPGSAIAAGCVDFVMPPDQIAEELTRIGNHPYVAPSGPATLEDAIPVPDGALAQIFHLIHGATGVDLSQYKPNTIKRRILRRMLLHQLESPDQYLERLRAEPAEVHALYEDVLINVTQFFRDPETFQVLKTDIFPKIAGEGVNGPVRIWAPGCSTGEE